jgi:hypothetical protein
MKTFPALELLEPRIAPAAVFTFTDVDGDAVTVHSSKGDSTDLMNACLVVGGQLQTIDVSKASFGAEFEHAAISITAVRRAGGTGDGKVNVGYFKATGQDLAAVKIGGDLGRIDTGDGDPAAPALGSLTADSMFRFGKSTQDANGSEVSTIKGRLGALRLGGDFLGDLRVLGGTDGRLGAITIGGSLRAEVNLPGSHGLITTEGDIGPIVVKGSLAGGAYTTGGGAVIKAGGKIASIAIGGSISGVITGGGFSGGILAGGDIGPVRIAHDLQGQTSANLNEAGFLRSDNGRIASLAIGGSLIGGTDASGGRVRAQTGIGNVTIGGEVLHGSIVSAAGLGTVSIGGSLIGDSSGTGVIRSALHMGAVTIGGDIVGGIFDAGRVDGGTIASVTVRGSVVGGSGPSTGVISASGELGPVRIGHDLTGGSGIQSGLVASSHAIASVAIGGSVYGGTADSSGRISAGGNLGPVTIAGDLKAAYVLNSGNVVAEGNITSIHVGGSLSTVGTNQLATAGTFSGSIRSGATIGSISIGGSVTGSLFAPAVISAKNSLPNVRIGGSLTEAQIRAGYDTSLSAANADAQIGRVSIGGDLIASDIVAGVQNLGADGAFGGTGLNADNVNFGDGHDVGIGGGNPAIIARIARITVGGQIFGTLNTQNVNDRFGIVAEKIGTVQVSSLFAALVAGAHNDQRAFGQGADFHLHEI